jgi:hypothetical protein
MDDRVRSIDEFQARPCPFCPWAAGTVLGYLLLGFLLILGHGMNLLADVSVVYLTIGGAFLAFVVTKDQTDTGGGGQS